MPIPTHSPIAVTGLAVVSALGPTPERTAERLASGSSGLARQTVGGLTESTCTGRAEEFRPDDQTRGLDRTFQLLYRVVVQAAQDSALPPEIRASGALIAGSPKAGLTLAARAHAALKSGGPGAVDGDFIFNLFPSHATGLLAQTLGMRGPALAPAAACNSGLSALQLGVDILRTGRAPAAVVGCSESSLTALTLAGYRNLGVLCPGDDPRAFRPFDRERRGFFAGEGAAAVVLEPLETAWKRGARIRGLVHGVFSVCEAFDNIAQEPEGPTVVRETRAMLEAAGLSPQDIGYVNLHGTGTRASDTVEMKIMESLFGTEPHPELRAGSTKPYTGHLLSASGLVEFVLCLICLQKNITPENLNLETPEWDFSPFKDGAPGAKLRYALSLNYGFGGSVGGAVAGSSVL